MTSRIFQSVSLVVISLVVASACVPGAPGLDDSFVGEVAPVVISAAPATLASHTFEMTFTVYDPDDDAVTLWDRCPYPDLEGAAPILRMGYSINGGTTFKPIAPADITVNGETLVVPTCGEVEGFGADIRIAATTSGQAHTFTWNSDDYIPTSSNVVFRVAVNDGTFTSDPGDTESFRVANLPTFEFEEPGMRPGETLVGIEIVGTLTTWSSNGTIVGAPMNGITLSNLAVTSSSAGTVTVTHSADTVQRPRIVTVVTPGAGIGGADEVSEGTMWTCAGMGEDIEEYETVSIGNLDQFACDQNDFTVTGTLFDGGSGGFLSGDYDPIRFVASSSGTLAFSLDWVSSNPGDVDDYDIFLFDSDGANELTDQGCYTVSKPEVCTTADPVVAGTEYVLIIHAYGGADNIPYTAVVTTP